MKRLQGHVGCIAAIVMMAAQAQPTPGLGAQPALKPLPKPQFELVTPKGGESLADVVKRNGLGSDAKTLQLFRELNPGIDSNDGPLDQSAKIRLIKVGNLPATSLGSDLGFQAHQTQLVGVRQEIQVARINNLDKAFLRTTVDMLQVANKSFETNALQMTPRQRILADAQMNMAAEQVRLAIRSGNQDTARLELLARESKAIAENIGRGNRTVTVKVWGRGNADAAPLMVYVLPIAYLSYGNAAEFATVRNLLQLYSFKTLTSPSRGPLEVGGRYILWVGPENNYDGMAKVVTSNKIVTQKYKLADTKIESNPEFIFEEDNQVQPQ